MENNVKVVNYLHYISAKCIRRKVKNKAREKVLTKVYSLWNLFKNLAIYNVYGILLDFLLLASGLGMNKWNKSEKVNNEEIEF